MVVVKIELWPHGNRFQARPLGMIRIHNDGTGDAYHRNYGVDLSHSGRHWGRPGCWRSSRLLNHPRNLSPYHLVARALAACRIK